MKNQKYTTKDKLILVKEHNSNINLPIEYKYRILKSI